MTSCKRSGERVAIIVVVLFAAACGRSFGADKPPAAGNIAPDFTLNSQEGTPVNLHDFRGKWVSPHRHGLYRETC
jgi:cytochrome oxidase Cu insertion factor (SCO1/SenC/PrrC family)